MAKFDFSHSYMNMSPVADKDDFFRSGLPEMVSLKSLISVSSRIFNIPTTNVILGVFEDLPRVYCLDLLEQSVNKTSFGRIFYLPLKKRLEIYDSENLNVPLYVWVKKKVQFSRTTILEQKVESHRRFDALINTISF